MTKYHEFNNYFSLTEFFRRFPFMFSNHIDAPL